MFNRLIRGNIVELKKGKTHQLIQTLHEFFPLLIYMDAPGNKSIQLITEMVFPRILDNLFPLVGADFGWGVPTTTRHQGAEKQILVAAFNVDLKGDMIGESLL